MIPVSEAALNHAKWAESGHGRDGRLRSMQRAIGQEGRVFKIYIFRKIFCAGF